MMAKKTGIKAEQFYSSANTSIGRKNRNLYTDENEIPEKKRQMNRSDKSEDFCKTPPLSITSRSCPDTTDKFYMKTNFGLPLSPQEVYYMSCGLNSNNKLKNKSNKSKKLMRGGNQNIKYKQQLDVYFESPKNKKLNTNVKVNMKINSPESLSSYPKSNQNADQSPKPSTQTNIRDFYSPKLGSDFKTPPKRENSTPNKEKKLTPLLSSNANTNKFRLNDFQRPKSSPKQLINNLTNNEDYENTNLSPNDVKSNAFIATDIVFDEEIPNIEENDIFSFSNNSEIQILEPNTPIGLRNLGNTCYMNSVVQSIFALKFFIEDLKNKFDDLKNISDYSLDFSMTQSLISLYNQYNGLRNFAEDCSINEVENRLSILKECVGEKWSPFKTCTQQDAAEFFGHIIDTIKEEFSSFKEFPQNNNPIARNFEFETGGSLTCKKCNNKAKIENEKLHALYLSLPEDNSLQTAFLDFLKDETTAHQCVSANCGANQNILNKYFTKLSKVLFLQLGRYTEDGSKRTEEVEVPLHIYLPLKHNNCENMIKLIAPSPLATPYRSKLQDVFISDKVSSVVRKMSFENICNLDNNVLDNLDITSSNTTNNTSLPSIDAKIVEMELDSNVINTVESLNCPQLQEVNGSDVTKKANEYDSTPKQSNDELEVSLQSMSNEKEENAVIKNSTSFSTNDSLSDCNNKENTAIIVNENSIEEDKSEKYQLVAVICHHGTSLSGGHYSSYVYNIETSQWFQCDDNDISLTDFESVQKLSKTSGYCYFYVHK